MKCWTCGEPIPPKEKGVAGRMKRYCRKQCTPQYLKLKHAGLNNCQVCGKELESVGTKGRPKRNCSKKCSWINSSKKHKRPKVSRPCQVCGTEFQTAKKDQKNCSKECRAKADALRAIEQHKQRTRSKYPDGTRTTTCGWCGEKRTFKIGESVVNAYHPACSKEAERTRYRVKTVKRQKHKNPNKISHEQVVRQHGSSCHICREQIDMSLPRTSKLGLTLDHVIPLSKGGTDTMDNLRPAHWLCNIKKSNKLPEELNA
jgi:hypothetical protein